MCCCTCEWCVYIETPGMTAPAAGGGTVDICGLWYWLDAAPGRDMILCIGIDTGRKPPVSVQHVPPARSTRRSRRPCGEWDDALARGNANRMPPKGYREAAAAWLPPVLSLILYLCSRAAEIAGGDGRPGNPLPVRTRRGPRLFAAPGPRHWEVGVRLGAALRHALAVAGSGGGGHGHQPRPHIRGAHWHTYLLGPRKDAAPAQRRRDLRWLPPIPVGVEDYDALPAVIRPVRPDDRTGSM